MKDTNKLLYITSTFQKEMPSADDSIDSIHIEGYANTTSVDRSGDVIPMTAWSAALENYKKNPIILAHHNHRDPIGKMVDHRVDDKGLWVKARISAAAEETFNLIKDGVLTAFSVGFIIKDAIYDSVTDLFIIKELELMEISVVSIPCNQDSTFSLSKAFDTDIEYSNFKSQYLVKSESAKGLESSAVASTDKTIKEFNMDPKELEALLAKAAADAADATTKALLAAQATEKAAVEAKALADAELNAKIAAAVQVGQSGAEKLLAEVEKRFATETETTKSVIAGLEASIKEKAEELAAIQKSKMSFGDKGAVEGSTYEEREKAVMLAKIMGKSISETKFGKGIIEKASISPHQPANGDTFWETEVSMNMENEIRRRLVVAPNFRQIAMQTNVMKIPVNPEAGDATWMANTAFGSSASAGSQATHVLKDITLAAYKVATLEYLHFEEEEDSLIILLPIIRDAMIRRVSRSVDKAFLYDSTAPFTGVAAYDTTSAVQVTNTGAVTTADLRKLRKDLGAWGLEPSELRYIVSTEVYYDLLDDTQFQSVSTVGDMATLLTGQVGSLSGTPVLVSSMFPSKAGGANTAMTNIGAICVAPGNFIAGNQRGLRFDTQDLVETQRKALVASLRTGLAQVSTVNGLGVSTFRWS